MLGSVLLCLKFLSKLSQVSHGFSPPHWHTISLLLCSCLCGCGDQMLMWTVFFITLYRVCVHAHASVCVWGGRVCVCVCVLYVCKGLSSNLQLTDLLYWLASDLQGACSHLLSMYIDIHISFFVGFGDLNLCPRVYEANTIHFIFSSSFLKSYFQSLDLTSLIHKIKMLLSYSCFKFLFTSKGKRS